MNLGDTYIPSIAEGFETGSDLAQLSSTGCAGSCGPVAGAGILEEDLGAQGWSGCGLREEGVGAWVMGAPSWTERGLWAGLGGRRFGVAGSLEPRTLGASDLFWVTRGCEML